MNENKYRACSLSFIMIAIGSACPAGFKESRGICFFAPNVTVTQAAAVAGCQQKGGEALAVNGEGYSEAGIFLMREGKQHLQMVTPLMLQMVTPLSLNLLCIHPRGRKSGSCWWLMLY